VLYLWQELTINLQGSPLDTQCLKISAWSWTIDMLKGMMLLS